MRANEILEILVESCRLNLLLRQRGVGACLEFVKNLIELSARAAQQVAGDILDRVAKTPSFDHYVVHVDDQRNHQRQRAEVLGSRMPPDNAENARRGIEPANAAVAA